VFETSRLTEFTRLFPPVSKAGGTSGSGGCAAQADSAAASAASPDGDGEGDEATTGEDDAEGTGGMKGAGARSAGKFKAASYNEIICQVPPSRQALVGPLTAAHSFFSVGPQPNRLFCKTATRLCA
jgi:hypothetical protein